MKIVKGNWILKSSDISELLHLLDVVSSAEEFNEECHIISTRCRDKAYAIATKIRHTILLDSSK